MSSDNWEHRSAGMICNTCMWFTRKLSAVGRCRRRAPTMNGYPVVFDTDWCGDHKLDERRAQLPIATPPKCDEVTQS